MSPSSEPSEKSFLTNALRRLSQVGPTGTAESDFQPVIDCNRPIGHTQPASSQPCEQLGKVATFISIHPLRADSVRQVIQLLQQIARDISIDPSSDASDGDANVLIVTADDLEPNTSELPNIGGIDSIEKLVSNSVGKRLVEPCPATVFESSSGASVSSHRLPAPLTLASFSFRQMVALLASCREFDWTFIYAGYWDSQALRPLVERSQEVFLISESGKAQYGEIQAIGSELKSMNAHQQGLIFLDAKQTEGILSAA